MYVVESEWNGDVFGVAWSQRRKLCVLETFEIVKGGVVCRKEGAALAAGVLEDFFQNLKAGATLHWTSLAFLDCQGKSHVLR